MTLSHPRWVLAGLGLVACDAQPEPEASDPWERGGFAVGHATVEQEDPTRQRAMTLEIWYPAEDATPGASSASLATTAADVDILQALLDAAPAGCPTPTIDAERNAPAWEREPAPLVLFSHCLNCGRTSSFTLAEWLASHGLVVVAPDHAGPLPFVEERPGEPLDGDQLAERAADLAFALDAAVDGALFDSDALAPIRIDPARIGVFGHSFGSVTAGSLAQGDGRVQAVAGLAAPMENPLLPGVEMANVTQPVMFVLAEEDNSIGELGNFMLRENYDEAPGAAWRVDLADAGHWSVSDIAGLVDDFRAGCGEGIRHSQGRDGEPFDYLDPQQGIEITAQHLTTFFAAQLTDSEPARARLADLPTLPGVVVHTRDAP